MSATLPERLKALHDAIGEAGDEVMENFAMEEFSEAVLAMWPELLAALENDARYRWLRECNELGVYRLGAYPVECHFGTSLDALIDAAIRAARPTACATDGGGNG